MSFPSLLYIALNSWCYAFPYVFLPFGCQGTQQNPGVQFLPDRFGWLPASFCGRLILSLQHGRVLQQLGQGCQIPQGPLTPSIKRSTVPSDMTPEDCSGQIFIPFNVEITIALFEKVSKTNVHSYLPQLTQETTIKSGSEQSSHSFESSLHMIKGFYSLLTQSGC